MMVDEMELLRRFVADGSQADFTELVRRRVDFVYTTARRQVGGDGHLAEDVTQAVFLALAREAPRLTVRSSLGGWLYTATRWCAAKAARSHRRWKTREQEATAMANPLIESAGPSWAEIRPVIDETMHEIPEIDREVLVLRFFEGAPLAVVGMRLGVAENAARMRVERALEKLERRLAKRGITSTAAALGSILGAQVTETAPVGLAINAVASAVAGVAQGAALSARLASFLLGNSKPIFGVAAVSALFSLAGYLGLKQSYAAQERSLARESVAARAGSYRLRREIRALMPEVVAVEAGVPLAEDPLARLREAETLLREEFNVTTDGQLGWPVPSGSLSASIRNFARFTGLTDGETEALDSVVNAGLAEFEAAVVAHARVDRAERELFEVTLDDEPEVHAAYDRLLAAMAALLGPDLYGYYESLGARAANEKLFEKWGLKGIYFNVAKVSVTPPGQPPRQMYQLSLVPLSSRLRSGWGTTDRKLIRLNYGPIESALPVDF
jgi:RNA polymerase sigma factor (sigma-70 family)